MWYNKVLTTLIPYLYIIYPVTGFIVFISGHSQNINHLCILPKTAFKNPEVVAMHHADKKQVSISKAAKRMTLLLSCSLLLTTAQPAVYAQPQDIAAQAEPGVSVSEKAAVRNGLYLIKGKYYYFKNGKKARNRWVVVPVTENGTTTKYRYYFQAAGDACTTTIALNGNTYCFTPKGRLIKGNGKKFYTIDSIIYCPTNMGIARTGWFKVGSNTYYAAADGAVQTNCVVKRNGKTACLGAKGALLKSDGLTLYRLGKYKYCPDTEGYAKTGWLEINQKLYYADSVGRILRNRTVHGIPLTSSGAAAANSIRTQAKMAARLSIAEATLPTQSSSEKLRSCWEYLTGSRFRYSSRSHDFNDTSWVVEDGLLMHQTHRGDCVSFACAFASIAYELGYKVIVLYGMVPSASGGFTSHCWVTVNGKFYDPEAQFSGWYRGIYGYSSYPMEHQVKLKVNYGSAFSKG